MSSLTASRTIQAPASTVFETIADVRQFQQAIPHIVNIEFLSDRQSGVGTRFRETRVMRGREAATELEVTEYVENDHVRIVTDAHGTVWDTVFTVRPAEDGTRLTMVMEARPHTWLAKLMTPLIKGPLRKALEADLDAVKSYCE